MTLLRVAAADYVVFEAFVADNENAVRYANC